MKKRLISSSVLLLVLLCSRSALGFCGFFVSRADTQLFNQASKVVLVRHDEKTVLTMANDFKGDPTEFAIVIPVPTFIERGQIHVADRALVDHLDAYSAPRLVEYFDENPCRPQLLSGGLRMQAAAATARETPARANSLGVTVEAEYTVGEYDIVILSAQESQGLETWLRRNSYRIPTGASRVLGSYLRQGMRFFVAKVNLEEQASLGYSYLRPLQVAYESAKFMLPIRLGMLNADGAQELFVFALTRKGRVETTNYRTVKLPTGMDLPVFLKGEFGDFYRDMFTRQVDRENRSVVFVEYAWDMSWCDPCAADPLSSKELRELGVFWTTGASPRRRPGPAQDVFVTRLHLRYDAEGFPEDLFFQETADRTNFQGRYVLRHPWTGEESCAAAEGYRREVVLRQEREAQALASLTGWDLAKIRRKMDLGEDRGKDPGRKWWQRLWRRE